MNESLLGVVFERIHDLESRNNEIERDKLFQLYRLADKILSGEELSLDEIEKNKLSKYMGS